MFLIPTYAVQVQQFAGALYGVRVGTQTMDQVMRDISASSLDSALNRYYEVSFGTMTTAAVASSLVKNVGITGNLATAASNAVKGLLDGAAANARGTVVNNILNAFATLTSNADFGAAATAWTANVKAASLYTGVANVEWSSITPSMQTLTVAQDNLMGSSGNDSFAAVVAQNALGSLSNTFSSGDIIDGGAGTDTLTAEIIGGANLVNVSMAIRAQTKSLENVLLTALESQQATDSAVFVDAAKMTGLTKVGSVGSNASLTIFNLTTLDDAGVKRNTSDVKVRMDHTSNSDASITDQEADLTVLFDQNYLMAGSTAKSSLELRIVNAYELAVASKPLTSFETLNFSIGGKAITVDISKAVDYADVASKMNAAINAAGITTATATVLTTRTAKFTDDITSPTGTVYAGGSVAGQYSPILISTTDGAAISGQVTKLSNNTSNFNGLNTWSAPAASTTPDPITANIELLKVGRGGDGGDLIVGGMSVDADGKGIEKFNVVVEGSAAQPSDLASLASTTHTTSKLKTVVVTAAAGAKAKLTIGNGQTADPTTINGATVAATADVTTAKNAALLDVRTFDASKFDNGVELHAAVTDASVAKYMNRKDAAPDAYSADNAAFAYTFGSGNDTVNVNISEANLAASGTTVREDFSMSINTGAGNDSVSTQIGDGADDGLSHWYLNHLGQENLSIATGDGNDTVRTWGAGAWTVTTGAGNDVVFSDNSGYVAVSSSSPAATQGAAWVIADPAGQRLTNLLGAVVREDVGADGATVQVTFASKGNTAAANAVGWESAAIAIPKNASNISTQYDLNQAIKAAINGSADLNKILVAEDGPSSTLIIRALIDGEFAGDELEIVVTDGPDLQTYVDDNFALAKTAAGVDIVGQDSTNANDNSIDLGDGDDILVLSTTTGSVETVVFSGASIGRDVIVNFDADDILDFSSYEALGVVQNVVPVADLKFKEAVESKILAQATADQDPTALADGVYIWMAENEDNLGEYAVYSLSVDGGDYVSASLVGVVDFGTTVDLTGTLAAI